MAGIGSRLGSTLPKCLTPLRGDYTILDHQLENLQAFADDISAVVGFRKELVRRRHPGLRFIENALFEATNTSQSLLIALDQMTGEDVLVLNGDVVFDPRVIAALLGCEQSCMAVSRYDVAGEEMKVAVDAQGRIAFVSKFVAEPVGEAIGINLIRAQDLELVTLGLRHCEPRDYFERGFEIAIGKGLALRAVDVTRFPCIEIDYIDDLTRAKEMFGSSEAAA
ncbi:MAG: NTP transferase domain-containing protein [Casimicrobiaceae bacterium]